MSKVGSMGMKRWRYGYGGGEVRMTTRIEIYVSGK